MTLSVLRTMAARRAPLVSFQISQRAGMHQTVARASGKESALNQEGRAEHVDREKTNSLEKAKAGKGQWNAELASDSESIVKADRGEVEASDETIKKLQEETKRVEK